MASQPVANSTPLSVPSRVLVVDDEPAIVELLTAYLQAEGYTVFSARDGHSALELVRTLQPALVVLDLILPGLDGVEVCRRIQQEFDIYVLMLSARADEVDKLIGLSVGADDYLTKPFSPRELVARVKAILRRSRALGPRQASARPAGRPALHFSELTIDPTSGGVWRQGSAIALTPREFDLLYVLAEQNGRACQREQLLRQVWGAGFEGVERVVDVHIKQIRHKIELDPANPTLIQTLRGIGYRFRGRRLE